MFRGVRRRVDSPGEMPVQDGRGGYGQDERISTAVLAVKLNEAGAYWMGGPLSRMVSSCNFALELKSSGRDDMASGGELLRNTVQLPPSCSNLFLQLKGRGTDESGIRGQPISRAYHLLVD